jgi:hypothetical protein
VATECVEKIFIDRNNALEYSMTHTDTDADSATYGEQIPYDLDANLISKVLVKVGSESFDSDAQPSAIFWAADDLTVKVGTLITQSGGQIVSGQIVLFDSANPQGRVWSEKNYKLVAS